MSFHTAFRQRPVHAEKRVLFERGPDRRPWRRQGPKWDILVNVKHVNRAERRHDLPIVQGSSKYQRYSLRLRGRRHLFVHRRRFENDDGRLPGRRSDLLSGYFRAAGNRGRDPHAGRLARRADRRLATPNRPRSQYRSDGPVFHVRLETGVASIAKHGGVNIMQFNIIYQMIDELMLAMADQLDPELVQKKIGSAEVRQIFPVGRTTAAGCLVSDGRIARDASARVLRKGEELFKGKVSMLKRFKEDVNEVRTGYECGVQLSGFGDYEEGDIIECFEIEKKRASL